MRINILCREGMGMFLYTTMRMGWEWENGHGNGRKWDRKSHSCTSLFRKNCKAYNITIIVAMIASVFVVNVAMNYCHYHYYLAFL